MKKSHVVYVTVGRFFQILIVAAQFRILTELLNETEIAKVYVLYAYQGFISLFLISPIGQYFTRLTRVLAHKRKLISSLFLQILFIIVASMLGSTVILLYSITTEGLFDGDLVTLVFMLAACSSVFQTVIPTLNILNHQVVFTNLNLANAILAFLISFFLVTNYEASINYWVSGQISSTLLLGLLGLIYLIKKYPEDQVTITGVKSTLRRINFKNLSQFAVPLMVTALGIWFLGAGYRLVVVTDVSILQFAGFVVSYALVNQLFSAFENLLHVIMQPQLYNDIKKFGSDSAFLRFYRTSMLLTIYFTLVFALSMPEFFKILISSQYEDFLGFTFFILAIEALRVVFNLNLQAFTIKRRTSLLYFPYILSVVCFFVLWNFSYSATVERVLLVLFSSYVVGCITVITLRKLYFKHAAVFREPIQMFLIPVLVGLFIAYINIEIYPDMVSWAFASAFVLIVLGYYGLKALRNK